MTYRQKFTTKWADFDPNRHMRHSAYYDYAAEIRVRFFSHYGYAIEEFAKWHIGPILFKEEASFYKEISLGEDIEVDMKLEAASENLERWRFTHNIIKADGAIAATVKVYGAWIDTHKRKLTAPPEAFIRIFKDLAKTADFSVIPIKNEK